jgi:hypothetical protein
LICTQFFIKREKTMSLKNIITALTLTSFVFAASPSYAAKAQDDDSALLVGLGVLALVGYSLASGNDDNPEADAAEEQNRYFQEQQREADEAERQEQARIDAENRQRRQDAENERAYRSISTPGLMD